MPLGNALGEAIGKITSVRITELGGGQRRTELDVTGEVTGQAAGQIFTTIVLEGLPGHAATYASTSTLLAASGAVIRASGRGMAMRTGEGHKLRSRVAFCLTTEDPKLAALNGLIMAGESEIDPATMTVKAISYEWK